MTWREKARGGKRHCERGTIKGQGSRRRREIEERESSGGERKGRGWR